jgi:hypothetical protein
MGPTLICRSAEVADEGAASIANQQGRFASRFVGVSLRGRLSRATFTTKFTRFRSLHVIRSRDDAS